MCVQDDGLDVTVEHDAPSCICPGCGFELIAEMLRANHEKELAARRPNLGPIFYIVETRPRCPRCLRRLNLTVTMKNVKTDDLP